MFDPTRVFIHYLGQLQHVLDIIKQNKGDGLLGARLHPDMLPLVNHVRAAANFTLRGCCPLACENVVSFDSEVCTVEALQQQIEQTVAYLNGLPKAQCEASTVLSEKAGFNEVALPADDFIMLYIVPNFFFHLNAVYAIARHEGVPLSKQDYDGFHGYPEGFSFER